MASEGPASAPVVGRDTAVVSALTLISRITGFVRVVTVAAVLGVGRFTDLYQSLNLLPNYTYELLSGSLITSLLVPPLVSHLDRGDAASVRRIANGFLTIVVAAATAVAAAIVLAGPAVVRLLTLGSRDPVEGAALARLGLPLLAVLIPQVVLYTTAATGAAVQQASGRFALAAAAPIVENAGIVTVLGIWAWRVGTGPTAGAVSVREAVLLGAGTTSAVALHAALQWYGAARSGIRLGFSAGWRDPEVRAVVSLARSSAGYAALNTVRLLAFLVAAGVVAGGQTVFLVALNFFNLPVALIGKPLATTAIAPLARDRDNHARFVRRYLGAVGLLLALSLPVAATMCGLAYPTALLGLWGRAGTPEAATLLAAAIAGTAAAVPGDSLFILSTSAAYARLDARSPLVAMAFRVVLSVSLIGAVVMAHHTTGANGALVLGGLGLAMAMADGAGASFLARRVVGREGLGRVASPHLATGTIVLCATAGTSFALGHLLGDSRLTATMILGVGGLLALLVILGASRRRGSELAFLVERLPAPPSRRSKHPSDGGAHRAAQPRVGSGAGVEMRTGPGPSTVGFGLALLNIAVAVTLLGMFGSPLAFALVPAALAMAWLAWRPATALYVLLALTPLTVGLRRGTVIPFLRPNEALLFAVAAGVAIHVLVEWRRGRRLRLTAGTDKADLAIGLLVLTGSILPVVVRFGRNLDLTADDLTQAFIFVKFGLLYLVARYVIRRPDQIRRCLVVTMVATAPVAPIAMAQALGVPGVSTALLPWLDQPPHLYIGRGAGTIGNSIALGDVMAAHLAIALSLVLLGGRRSGRRPSIPTSQLWWLRAAVAVFALGAVGSGQFSGFLAAGIAVVVVAVSCRRPATLLALPIVAVIGVTALWPVVVKRVGVFTSGSGLPQSWQVRVDNLQRFFLPVLGRHGNWFLGVRPDTSVPNPNEFTGETFIESGWLWLLWVGGVFLLVAFLVFIAVAFRRFRRAARARDPWLGAVGASGTAITTFVALLTLTDPHVTMRGIADVFYPLLALAVATRTAPAVAEDRVRADTRALVPAIGYIRYSAPGQLVKRLVDVVVSAFLLVALAPVMVAIAYLIRRTSPGPALFRQERVGFGEQPFTILKFRTMRADNDDSEHRAFVQAMLRGDVPAGLEASTDGEPRFKLVADRRITPVGRWLRRTSLDELPQLINVLRGEMSLVGPRPCLGYEVTEFTPRQRLRAASLPGMTGLWQVEGRSDMHMQDALDLDLRYVETCSIAQDMTILLRTVKVVARGV